MSLPRPTVPHYTEVLPISKNEVSFRPFFVDEEKIMRMALTADDEKTTFKYIRQVCEQCLDASCKKVLDKISITEFMYLFLKIKTKSIGEKTSVSFSCNDCEKGTVHVEANIEELTFNVLEEPESIIDISDGFKLKLKPITVNDFDPENEGGDLLMYCIDSVYNNAGESFKFSEHTLEDKKGFVASLLLPDAEKIVKYIEDYPSLSLIVEGKCDGCGKIGKHDIGEYTNFFE